LSFSLPSAGSVILAYDQPLITVVVRVTVGFPEFGMPVIDPGVGL